MYGKNIIVAMDEKLFWQGYVNLSKFVMTYGRIHRTFCSAYTELCPGSFVGDIERIFQLKLIIHLLV